MTRLLTLLLLVSGYTTYAQSNAMNDRPNVIKLELHTKTVVNDSLSIVLTSFSHKTPMKEGQVSVASANLSLFQDDTEHELMLSMYGVRGKSMYENGLTDEERYPTIIWNEYTILLKSFSYDESIDVVIIKTEELIKKTIALGKPKLILQANALMARKYPDFKFDPTEFKITTWANSKKIVVKYRQIIRFTPLGKQGGLLGSNNLDYDFEVDLLDGQTSFDTWGIDRFYVPTDEEQEKIDFVIKAFGLPHVGFEASIIEESNTYRINLENEWSFGYYVIDKTTGIQCDGAIQGSYDPMPDDMFDNVPRFPDPLVEITE